jgi:hypothetical protein
MQPGRIFSPCRPLMLVTFQRSPAAPILFRIKQNDQKEKRKEQVKITPAPKRFRDTRVTAAAFSPVISVHPDIDKAGT